MTTAYGRNQVQGQPNRPLHESLPNTLSGLDRPASLGHRAPPWTAALVVLLAAVAALAVAVLAWHPV